MSNRGLVLLLLWTIHAAKVLRINEDVVDHSNVIHIAYNSCSDNRSWRF